MKTPIFALVLSLTLIVACGKKSTSTEPSVRSVTDSGPITLQSITSSSVLSAFGRTSRAVVSGAELRFCVKRVKLYDEEGHPVIKETAAAATQSTDDESDDSPDEKLEKSEAREDGEIVFSPGLIDLTTGTKNWGQLEVPKGFVLRKLKVKVKVDREACGVDYSVKYGNLEIKKDVEFIWVFRQPVSLDTNVNVINLSFDTIVTALKQAATSGDAEKIKESIENVEAEVEAE